MELKNKFSGEVESEVTTLTHSPADRFFVCEKLTKLMKMIHGENLELNTNFCVTN